MGTPTCAAASEIFIGPPGHSLRTLPHSTRQVPALLAEGRWRPRTLPLANVSHLVEHPAARILIDPGTPVDLQPVIAQLPTPLRQLVRPARRPLATVEALELGGVEPSSLDLALPTHLHWDHVSGLADLPGLELAAHEDEWNWALRSPSPPTGIGPALTERRTRKYALDGPPVLTFPRSHDLFGDGAVTLVDLAGHTPGSVGVLLHTTDGWVLLIGDVAWLGCQVGEARQKSAVPGAFVDADRGHVDVAASRARARVRARRAGAGRPGRARA